MSCDLQHESITKFIISDHPIIDNFPNPAEFKKREKAWLQERDVVLAQHISWVEKEQVAELAHSAEATCVAAEKHKHKQEAVEQKQLGATHKRASSSADIIASSVWVGVRCLAKGQSLHFPCGHSSGVLVLMTTFTRF